jgi:hypothetical protein
MDIGKIYKISGYGLNYYGSTTESIKRRLARHLSHYSAYKIGKRTDRITAFNIFDKGDDYTIELIEHFICPDKKTLLDKENFYITNNECINKCVPNRTPEQLKERQHLYNEKHKEQIKQTAKEWAEQDRRAKGCKKREEMVITKAPDYSARKKREARAKETPEQREVRLAKRRAERKPLTEEQKERAKERARKQREKINSDPELKEAVKQYKTEKAKEYRAKAKEVF